MSKSAKEIIVSEERLEYLKSRKVKKVSIILTQILILVVFLAQWEII